MGYPSVTDILRVIVTPKVGESAEGCCTIWLCVACTSVYHEEVIERCAQCGEQVYSYVQGDQYVALAKQFLNMVTERDGLLIEVERLKKELKEAWDTYEANHG